jgi:hypothetical protein
MTIFLTPSGVCITGPICSFSFHFGQNPHGDTPNPIKTRAGPQGRKGICKENCRWKRGQTLALGDPGETDSNFCLDVDIVMCVESEGCEDVCDKQRGRDALSTPRTGGIHLVEDDLQRGKEIGILYMDSVSCLSILRLILIPHHHRTHCASGVVLVVLTRLLRPNPFRPSATYVLYCTLNAPALSNVFDLSIVLWFRVALVHSCVSIRSPSLSFLASQQPGHLAMSQDLQTC